MWAPTTPPPKAGYRVLRPSSAQTCRLVNLGVSGSTLAQALQEQLGPAVDAQPDVVTVWLAVNDLNARVPLEQYAADLETLLGQLDRRTRACWSATCRTWPGWRRTAASTLPS